MSTTTTTIARRINSTDLVVEIDGERWITTLAFDGPESGLSATHEIVLRETSRRRGPKCEELLAGVVHLKVHDHFAGATAVVFERLDAEREAWHRRDAEQIVAKGWCYSEDEKVTAATPDHYETTTPWGTVRRFDRATGCLIDQRWPSL